MPANVLIETHETISIPLSTLINKSFIFAVFTDIYKIAKVALIFKSMTWLLCSNYWLISLLSNIGKIIKKLIHLRLNLFLETHNYYYLFQFGFRLNFSTNIMIKLDYHSVRGIANEWFSLYLKNRKQFASISDHIWSIQVIQAGVPQGSVLGPFVFLLHENDLNKSIKNLRAYHFADDTNILLSNEALELLAKHWTKTSKIVRNG